MIEYEKLQINDGSVFYQKECAIKIQKLWRGYRARKRVARLRELVPPKEPAKRQEFYMKKVSPLSSLVSHASLLFIL
jgi:hypothetical protein